MVRQFTKEHVIGTYFVIGCTYFVVGDTYSVIGDTYFVIGDTYFVIALLIPRGKAATLLGTSVGLPLRTYLPVSLQIPPELFQDFCRQKRKELHCFRKNFQNASVRVYYVSLMLPFVTVATIRHLKNDQVISNNENTIRSICFGKTHIL